MAPTGGILLTWILILMNVIATSAWDSDDLELFDLVEEINRNFYDVLGIEQSASSQDIRRAYRKLSLQFHPDKNKEDDAETKFRQLVAVYEVLKDENKRKKYHDVLENGLPDWRQPVFYYRRVRKMGILEFFTFMVVILTVGQYIVMWSIFAEKKFTLTENFEAVRKRREKKLRKTKSAAEVEDEMDEELQGELDAIPRPSLSKLWPILLSKYVALNVVQSPTTVRDGILALKEWREQRRLAHMQPEIDEQEEEIQKRPKKKPKSDVIEAAPVVCSDGAPVVYTELTSAPVTEEENKPRIKEGEWTDDELALLAKAASKFPGGTLNRWEKIADMVGRSIPEVTCKCKTLKSSYVMNLDVSVQSGGTKPGKKIQNITEDMISVNTELDDSVKSFCDNDSVETKVRRRHKPLKPQKTAERTLMISAGAEHPEVVNKQTESESSKRLKIQKQPNDNEDVAKSLDDCNTQWNKNQQTILEWALRQYPKGTDQRWDKIAEHIPGKTKEDCIYRFKYLADLVKKKKEMTQKSPENS